MILGIALVVDELNKGPRLVIRYPDSSSVSQGVDTASVILYRLQTEFISISKANFAKLFRPKPALCEKVVELTINEIKYISYACNCPQLSETTTERSITQYNIIIAKARDDIICSRIIDAEHVSRYVDTKSVKEVVSMFAVTLKKLEIYSGYVSDQVRIMLQYIDELDISNNTTSRTPLVSETVTSNTTTTNMNNTANINNSTYNTQISKNISGSNDSTTSTVSYQPIVTNNLSDNTESVVSTNNTNSNTGMNSIGVGNDSYTSQIKDISTGYGNSASGSSSATAQLNNMHLSSGIEVNIRASRYINTLQSPSQYSAPPYSWNTTTVSPQGQITSTDSMMMATTNSQVGTMNINNTTNYVLSSSSSVNTLTTIETTPTIITTTQSAISNMTNTTIENNTNITMNTMVDNIYKQREVLDKMIRASSLANELRIFYHQLIDNKEVNMVLDQQYNIYVPLSYMNSNATNVTNNHHVPSHFSPRYMDMDMDMNMDKSDNSLESKRFDNTMMTSSSSSKSWTIDQLQPYHSLLLLDSYENTIRTLIHRLYPSALHSSTADEYITAAYTTTATGTTINNGHIYRSCRENNSSSSSSNQRISPNSRHPSIQGRGIVQTEYRSINHGEEKDDDDDDDGYNNSSEDDDLNYSSNSNDDNNNEYNLDEISTSTSTSISSEMNHDNVVNHIDNHHRGPSPSYMNTYSNNTITTTLEKLLPNHLIQFLKVIDSTKSFIEYCPLLQLSLHEIYEVALVLVRYDCGRIIHVITEDSIYQISPYIIHSSSSSSRSTLLTHRNSIKDKDEESSDQWEKYNQEFMNIFLQTQDTSEDLSEGTDIEVDKDIHIHTCKHRNSVSNNNNGDNIPNIHVGNVSEVNSLRKRRYTPVSSVPTNIHITDSDDSRSLNINQTNTSSHNSMSDKGIQKSNYAYYSKVSDKNTSQSMKNPVVFNLSTVMNDSSRDPADAIVCSLDLNKPYNRTNIPIEIKLYMYLKYILSLFQDSRNLKTVNVLFPSTLQSQFIDIIIWLFRRQLIQEVETYVILPTQHTTTSSNVMTSKTENISTSMGSVSRSISASSPLIRQIKTIPTDNTMKIQDNPSVNKTTDDSNTIKTKKCERSQPYTMISNHDMMWYEQLSINSFLQKIDQNNVSYINTTHNTPVSQKYDSNNNQEYIQTSERSKSSTNKALNTTSNNDQNPSFDDVSNSSLLPICTFKSVSEFN